MNPRLLYLGDVPIRPDCSGGSVVLWRHQQLYRNGKIESASPTLGYKPAVGALVWRLLRRLRLGRLGLILQPWLRQLDLQITANQAAVFKQQADAILTVAHGLAWLQAMKAARSTGLPLITVVHDWYPDASGCPRWGLWVWERTFRQLMRQSALIFAVSEGMVSQIGPHPNLHVLPPIPDPELKPCPPRQSHSGPWRLYYSGLCEGLYAPLLQELISAVAADQRFTLHLSGPGHQELNLPPGNQRLRCSGFLNGEVWQQAFDEADALVLVLSFEQRHRRHLATHFPSKLVEYANRGRPIVIWGPPWSSAVQWGQGKSHIQTHSMDNPDSLLESIMHWLPQQPCRTQVDQSFNAISMAAQLDNALNQLLGSDN